MSKGLESVQKPCPYRAIVWRLGHGNQRAGEILELNHDFTGDGLPDLAFRSRPDRVDIYPYQPERRVLAKKPAAKIGVGKEAAVLYKDFNHDGRADLLTFDSEKQALTVIISRK